MLKILRDLWAQNEGILKKALEELDHEPNYSELVSLTFNKIYDEEDTYNYDSMYRKLDIEHMTHIDNGDYQGTHIFLIPFDTYQPGAGEYLMTYVDYGSCSGCDTLLRITGYLDPPYNEQQIKDLITLCRHIVMNTIKPYNYGWRHEEEFDQVEFEEEITDA